MTDYSEDIFRRAAENYPLKTDNPDWDAVRKKMEADGAATEEMTVPKKRNKRWLLLLLMLVPFAVIEYKYAPLSNLFDKGKHAETGKPGPVVAKSTEQAAGQTTAENKERTTDAITINQTPALAKDLKDANTTIVDQAVAKQKNSTTSTTTITAANQTASLTHDPAEENSITTKHTINTKKNNNRFENNVTGEKINVAHNSRHITSKQKSRIGIKNAEATGDDNENKITSTAEITSKEKNTAVVTETEISKVPVDAGGLIVKEEPVIKKSIADSAKATVKEIAKTTDKTADKNEKKRKPHQKHFYVGLMAGPDFSEVKMQSVRKVGVSFGLIAGYQINKRLSIETGFFKDEKLYCSEGKYFSTKNIRLYPNTSIDYVSGKCYMYEIPLNVSYTFLQKKRSSMFAIAGISSYLMNKESYDYNIKYDNGTTYPYSKDYKSHDNQFAAVINISAGYTYKLGKIGDLRIEPYLKLPVNKVGTGDLPIQSFGIMVGATKKLF